MCTVQSRVLRVFTAQSRELRVCTAQSREALCVRAAQALDYAAITPTTFVSKGSMEPLL